MISVNREHFNSSFPGCLSFLFLVQSPRLESLVQWREQTSLSCSSSQGENVLSFTIKYNVSFVFLIDVPSIKLRKIPFISSFLSIFIKKGYWILFNGFSASIEMAIKKKTFITSKSTKRKIALCINGTVFQMIHGFKDNGF